MNITEKYQSIRKIGMELNGKLLASIPRNDFNKAARLMKFMKMHKVYFKDEGEQFRFYDFVINDCLDSKGLTAVEKFNNKYRNTLDEVEIKLIDSLIEAKPSVYSMEKIDVKNSYVWLQDLLEPDSPLIRIIDFGFCKSEGRIDQPLFTRIIGVDEIAMTSGATMMFDVQHKVQLINQAQDMFAQLKDTQMQRSLVFNKLFKKFGYKRFRYQDPTE
jgi:hypothetical protein